MKWNCDSESFDVTHHNKILKASSESPWRANMRTYEVNLYVTWVWREKRFPAHNTSLFSRKKNRQQNAVDSGNSAAILQSKRIASGLKTIRIRGIRCLHKRKVSDSKYSDTKFPFWIPDSWRIWEHFMPDSCLFVFVNTKRNPVLNRF